MMRRLAARSRVSFGFPADALWECLTLLHELSEADGSIALIDLAAAVARGPDGPPRTC